VRDNGLAISSVPSAKQAWSDIACYMAYLISYVYLKKKIILPTNEATKIIEITKFNFLMTNLYFPFSFLIPNNSMIVIKIVVGIPNIANPTVLRIRFFASSCFSSI